MIRAFFQGYLVPPHCKAISKQTIDARKIANDERSSFCKLCFQLDFSGVFKWIRNITAAKVGTDMIGFIQKILNSFISTQHSFSGGAYHRQVVPEMIPPPMRGPQRKDTPDTAPSNPLKRASLERGTDSDMIVNTPDKIPPAPIPAIVRPLRMS
jgi:hypothetical protein